MPPQTPTPDTSTPETETCKWYSPLCKVTNTSKILTAVIFIILPFVGGYAGYTLGSKNVEYFKAPLKTLTPSLTEIPDNVIRFKDYYDDSAASFYSIRNGFLYYEEENLGVQPKRPVEAFDERLVLVDGKLFFGDKVLVSTESVRELGSLGSDVFLTDNAIYKIEVSNEGVQSIITEFTDVNSGEFKPVNEFVDTSSSLYLRPLADGGYSNRWFSDSKFFYCIREAQTKLPMPITVVFHPIDKSVDTSSAAFTVGDKMYPLWDQVNNKNTIGYITFKNEITNTEYDTSCNVIIEVTGAGTIK